MAEDVAEEIENALNLVVTTTDQSSNMRKTLKEMIYQIVSTLRQLFSKITLSGEQKVCEINNLTKKISTLEAELLSYKEQHNKRQQAPSIDNEDDQGEPRAETQPTASTGATLTLAEQQAHRVALPNRQLTRQYAAVVKDTKPR
jgi:alkyl hydroperoxide reductase subunit AhpF